MTDSGDDMLEYLFFNRSVADKFAEKLRCCGLTPSEEQEPVQEAILLRVREGIADDLWDELDDYYDQLSIEDQALLEQSVDDADAHTAAGIYLSLANGQQTLAKVPAETVNKILSVLEMDEFNQFVDIIVRSVETPDDSPICQRDE